VTRLQWYRGLCGGVGPCEGVVSCIIGTLLWPGVVKAAWGLVAVPRAKV
jgi:hypothetical protein